MVLIEELRRRYVLRAAALYIAVAWGATETLSFLIQALSSGNAAAVASAAGSSSFLDNIAD
jgi:hypothetical protein